MAFDHAELASIGIPTPNSGRASLLQQMEVSASADRVRGPST